MCEEKSTDRIYHSSKASNSYIFNITKELEIKRDYHIKQLVVIQLAIDAVNLTNNT